MALFEPEFVPGAAFGDAGVDTLAVDGGANAAGGFDFLLAVIGEAVGYDGFGAVFVGIDRLWGERVGVVELVVVRPVSVKGMSRRGQATFRMRSTYFAIFDMFALWSRNMLAFSFLNRKDPE